MKWIDFHTHIYPDAIAQRATQSTCSFYDLHTELVGSVEGLLAQCREAGVTHALLLPVAVKADQVRHINAYTAQIVAEYTPFEGFGAYHAAVEDPAAELEALEALKLRGVKLHPDIQQFAIDDPRLFPMYEALGDRLPVMLHCGDPRYDYSHPQRLKRLLHLFPKLRVIGAHMGGWELFDEAFELLHSENCYLDISSSRMFMTPEKMRRLIQGYGADRLLFGTDFPLWSLRDEVEAFKALGLSAEEEAKITWRNAMALLPGAFERPGVGEE